MVINNVKATSVLTEKVRHIHENAHHSIHDAMKEHIHKNVHHRIRNEIVKKECEKVELL